MEADLTTGDHGQFKVEGEPSIIEDLFSPKAKELASLLDREVFPFVRLVGCFRLEFQEVIVLDVEPEVPQKPVHDIQEVERIAVHFDLSDVLTPNPKALRKDFPVIPHTNVGFSTDPRSLCLFEKPYSEQKLTWTAAGFIRQLHDWLSLSAKGALHREDQPLEQFFLGYLGTIELPAAVFDPGVTDLPEFLILEKVYQQPRFFARARFADSNKGRPVGIVGWIYDSKPRVHGVVSHTPKTLGELDQILDNSGETLVGDLKCQLLRWFDENPEFLDQILLVVGRFPRIREEGRPPERVEVWAMATKMTIREIGEALGLWQEIDGQVGLIISSLESRDSVSDKTDSDVQLGLFNPVSALTPRLASSYNGLSNLRSIVAVAVGAGALGSQVIDTFVRAGFGRWLLIDHDILMPHNLARHQLLGDDVGRSKAMAMAEMYSTLYESPVIRGVCMDVLADSQSNDLKESFRNADLILDMSTSINVSRHLGIDVESAGRRISAFLSPSGRDLVLLAESADREVRIDHVEMEYYRALYSRPELGNHLSVDEAPRSYGYSCSDSSVLISQENVGLHSAICARSVRTTLESESRAVAKIWKTENESEVRKYDLEVSAYQEITIGSWVLGVSNRCLEEMRARRLEHLPNETGGVFIGSTDMIRRRIYVVGFIPAPPDSVERPYAFERGKSGLREELQSIHELTGSQLWYLGEWHSHPKGSLTRASDLDKVLFCYLADNLIRDGVPPIMAIIGDQSISWFCESVDSYEEISFENE